MKCRKQDAGLWVDVKNKKLKLLEKNRNLVNKISNFKKVKVLEENPEI